MEGVCLLPTPYGSTRQSSTCKLFPWLPYSPTLIANIAEIKSLQTTCPFYSIFNNIQWPSFSRGWRGHLPFRHQKEPSEYQGEDKSLLQMLCQRLQRGGNLIYHELLPCWHCGGNTLVTEYLQEWHHHGWAPPPQWSEQSRKMKHKSSLLLQCSPCRHLPPQSASSDKHHNQLRLNQSQGCIRPK